MQFFKLPLELGVIDNVTGRYVFELGAEGRIEPPKLRIFNRMLCKLSYLGICARGRACRPRGRKCRM
jgi:hypothetical protein